MTFRKALLAATMLALPVAAQAQPVTGLYVGAGIGLNMLMETDVDLNNRFSAPRSGTAEFDYGYLGVISLGWGFGNGVRAEIEGSYRSNDVDSLTGFGLTSPVRSSGTAVSYGVMGNAIYDFDLGPTIPLMPYIGLGAGYIVQEFDGLRATSGGDNVNISDSQGRFAYQAIIGAAFQLDAIAPGLALTTEYRFMGTLGHEADATANRGGRPTERGSVEWDNFNHSVLLGIRYAFNAAPPPAPVVTPAPAAAPAPARTFLVFFDFDRSDLTDRARAIIAEAATNAGRVGTTRIEIAGHADRSGTPQYNQALSERRAAAVAAELERRGIARSVMTVQAFGESRPLVPTADGVREPQNRRVEIVLR
jgi:outer membrane protein OmpA-like peptidoglycan-associated protein